MSQRVLTITLNPSVDIGTETEVVIPDQKTRCNAPMFDPGGGGINVSRVLTRLSIYSDALFICGGYTGNRLKEMMDEERIPVLAVESPDITRQNISIIENNAGHQFRFVLPGVVSNDATWNNVLNRITDIIDNYDYVVASGSLPIGVPDDIYSQIGSIVNAAGKKFVLDTSGPSLFNGIKNGAEFIKPNQEEFIEMKRIFGASDNDQLCRLLFDKGVKNIIHTLGKEKTVLITPDSTISLKPPTIKLRSTIGAGDSFIGGMIAGLINGLSKKQSVGFGIAAAASTLQSEGTDLCDADEVQQIYQENFG